MLSLSERKILRNLVTQYKSGILYKRILASPLIIIILFYHCMKKALVLLGFVATSVLGQASIGINSGVGAGGAGLGAGANLGGVGTGSSLGDIGGMGAFGGMFLPKTMLNV